MEYFSENVLLSDAPCQLISFTATHTLGNASEFSANITAQVNN